MNNNYLMLEAAIKNKVYDKVKWHLGDSKNPEDPKQVIDRFLYAFAMFERQNMLTSDGAHGLSELRMIKKNKYRGADTTDVGLSSSDLTPSGIRYADKHYKNGIS